MTHVYTYKYGNWEYRLMINSKDLYVIQRSNREFGETERIDFEWTREAEALHWILRDVKRYFMK